MRSLFAGLYSLIICILANPLIEGAEIRAIIENAERFIPVDFSKKFSFFRRGWEYCLGSMHIYVEEIDGLSPSIEVLGPSREEIFNLFKRLNVIKVITDSVPEWYDKKGFHACSSKAMAAH